MAPELTSESVPEVTSHRSDHERSEDQSARLGMCKMRQGDQFRPPQRRLLGVE